MAAGVAPIRGTKARYYEDRRFTERLLPAPKPQTLSPDQRPKDDWTGLAPIAAPTPPARQGAGGAKAAAASLVLGWVTLLPKCTPSDDDSTLRR